MYFLIPILSRNYAVFRIAQVQLEVPDDVTVYTSVM